MGAFIYYELITVLEDGRYRLRRVVNTAPYRLPVYHTIRKYNLFSKLVTLESETWLAGNPPTRLVPSRIEVDLSGGTVPPGAGRLFLSGVLLPSSLTLSTGESGTLSGTNLPFRSFELRTDPTDLRALPKGSISPVFRVERRRITLLGRFSPVEESGTDIIPGAEWETLENTITD